jgi:hypothetical protein
MGEIISQIPLLGAGIFAPRLYEGASRRLAPLDTL